MSALHIPFHHSRSAGEEYLRANRFTEAEAAFAGEAASRPRDPRPLLALGHLALMGNDLPRAEQLLSQAVARDRKCHQASELLAEVSYRRDDFATAATHQRAAGNDPIAAKLDSFAGRRPYVIEGPDSTRAPFVRTDPLPIVMVRLNGGAEVPFFLDTGGAEVILDASFARASGVPLFGSQTAFFGGGKAAGLGHGAVDSLTIGDTTVRNLPVNVLDLAPMGPMLEAPGLAGCIGTCLLYRFLATIDYPGEALVLRRKAPLSKPVDAAIDVPFLLADDHFMLAVGRLNDGSPTTFFVDSGLAGGAFACPASTLKEAGVTRGSGPIVEGHGGGGAMKVWPFDVASLSLDDARLQGLQGIAGAFPPQLEWAFGFRIGGLISHGFLRSYAVTFDFERMAIRLEPASV
jgi:hypothetical protein